MRLPNERLYSAFKSVSKINVDARASISFFQRLTVVGRPLGLPIRFGGRSACPAKLFEVSEQRGLRFLIGQRFGALLAALHNEFVQCGINGQGIIAVETS